MLEHAMRAALTAAGARLLQAVLATDDDGYAGPHARCGNGHQAGYAGCRDKTITTVPGPVRVARAWYHCGECGCGFAPRDQQLGVAGMPLSPGLAQMIARAGAEVPSGKAAGLLADLAGVSVSAGTVERSAEASGAAARAAGAAGGAAIRERRIRPLPPKEPVPDMLYIEAGDTGVPVRPGEAGGRRGKGEDGTARTREIKLARFFTVSGLDDDGSPVMDPGSSSYVATFGGKRHPRRAGRGRVPAPRRRPLPPGRQWLEDRNTELGDGDTEAIIAAARQYPPAGVKTDELDKKLGYFEHNLHRMRYAHFKKPGMFIGSGAIEGAIKAIAVQRAKQSGTHWATAGAAGIIAPRCQHASGRWAEPWTTRAATPAGLQAAI
ncbi:MAG: hypothetical protein ACM3ML_25270 [Micromonosporaceae bacterium]